jgi:hypothetical protein
MFADFFLEPIRRYIILSRPRVELIFTTSDSYAALCTLHDRNGHRCLAGLHEVQYNPELIKKYGGKIAFMGEMIISRWTLRAGP